MVSSDVWIGLYGVAHSDSYNEYNAKAQQLASTLMSIIVQGLEVDPAHFERYTKNSGGYFRWNYYPACPVPEQTLGLKPHTDFNLVTILFQSDVGGLQIEKDGRWVAVKPRPGALCVNIGDTTQVDAQPGFIAIFETMFYCNHVLLQF
jgi:isopenicillin N synthase-like dioxygenase